MEDEHVPVLHHSSLRNALQRKALIDNSQETKEEWEESERTSRLKVVLVMERDDLLRDTIVHILRGEGYFVLATADEALALDVARENPLSLVFLDSSSVSSPLVAFCQQERSCSQMKHVYLVMMIMHESEIASIESHGFRADDYIKKPLRPEELCACVQTLLRTERQHIKPKPGKAFLKPRQKVVLEHESILTVEDLSIDMAQHLICRNDHIVDLQSSILFDLLVYLVRHRCQC